MDPMCSNEPPPRQKIPKDGMGPRGLPDCYYVRFSLCVKFISDKQIDIQTNLGKNAWMISFTIKIYKMKLAFLYAKIF